jgi:hypothetical protein
VKHLRDLYWMMLLVRALKHLFQHDEIVRCILDLTPDLREQMPIVTLRFLMDILRGQQADGSFGGVCEVTAYAILALASLETLPWIRQLNKGKITAAIALGKSFLHSNRNAWTKGHYLWIEKVTYSSAILSEAYCLAAAMVPLDLSVPEAQIHQATPVALLPDPKVLVGMRKAGTLVGRTCLFSHTDPFILRVAEMQAAFDMQALERLPVNIFPRTAKGKDEYRFLIPLALTATALETPGSRAVSPWVLREMMVLSTLNFHVDEYMEGVVERYFGDDLGSIRRIVGDLFTKDLRDTRVINGHHGNGGTNMMDQEDQEQLPTADDVKAVLGGYIRRILYHPAVIASPRNSQVTLAFELQAFLLAHITQAEANNHLRAQDHHTNSTSNGHGVEFTNGNGILSPNSPTCSKQQESTPPRSFYSWVRSISANHTSCPFSFVFYNCLLHYSAPSPSSSVSSSSSGSLSQFGNKKTVFTTSALASYLAEDMCRHLASLCRMYNDAASVARDADEQALNSVDFPEFLLRKSGMRINGPAGLAGCRSSILEGLVGNGGGSSSWSDHIHLDNEGDLETAPAVEDLIKSKVDELLRIAEYERRGLEMAMALLGEELRNDELMGALRVFVNVTDLYGQIYLLKDVGTRTR